MFNAFDTFTESKNFCVVTRRRLVLAAFGLPLARAGGGDSSQRERSEFDARVGDPGNITGAGGGVVPRRDEDSAASLRDYTALRAYHGRATGI